MFVKIKNYLSRKISTKSKERFEYQFQKGKWDGLSHVDDLARYSIIAGYCSHFKKNASLLDVGCAQGVLQDRLIKVDFTNIVGIDFSEEGIRMAQPKSDNITRFEVGDMNKWKSNEMFDIIVFNESLYYADDHLAVLKRFENQLNKGGIFIISMFDRKNSPELWEDIETNYGILHQTKITNPHGTFWNVKVFEVKN